jgi:hypothetical protein
MRCVSSDKGVVEEVEDLEEEVEDLGEELEEVAVKEVRLFLGLFFVVLEEFEGDSGTRRETEVGDTGAGVGGGGLLGGMINGEIL